MWEHDVSINGRKIVVKWIKVKVWYDISRDDIIKRLWLDPTKGKIDFIPADSKDYTIQDRFAVVDNYIVTTKNFLQEKINKSEVTNLFI